MATGRSKTIMAKKTARKKATSNSNLLRFSAQFILIFVSVTLALLFDEWRSRQRDQQLEAFYLEQMEQDLQQAIRELESDLHGYQDIRAAQRRLADYVLHSAPAPDDTLLQLIPLFFREIYPEAHNLAFEALRNTGKLDILKNKAILKNLLYINQEALPRLRISIDGYLRIKREQLTPFFLNNWPGYQGGPALHRFLQHNLMRNFLQFSFFEEITRRYEKLLATHRNLLHLVEEERQLSGPEK